MKKQNRSCKGGGFDLPDGGPLLSFCSFDHVQIQTVSDTRFLFLPHLVLFT